MVWYWILAAGAETIRGLFCDGVLSERVRKNEIVERWRGVLPQMAHTDELGGFQLLEILRRKRPGFAVNVVDGWFDSCLSRRLPQLFLDESSLMFEMIKPERVRGLLEDHRSGQQDNHKLLFSLVMLEQGCAGYARIIGGH